MPSKLDWRGSEDTRDIVHLVVQALVEGRRVALPAENGYYAIYSGLNHDSLDHAVMLKETGGVGDFCLLLRSSQELLDYIPDLSRVTARIASRAWPSALELSLVEPGSESLFAQLDDKVRNLVSHNGRVAFRVSSHDCLRHALRLMPGPLLAAPLLYRANKSAVTSNGSDSKEKSQIGSSDPDVPKLVVSSADMIENTSAFAIVVDDGETPSAGLATRLSVDHNRCQIDQMGVYPLEAAIRAGQMVILLVCTGNTCRSPMAAAMLRDKIASRFGGSEVADKIAFVASAGLNAFPGGPASIEAQAVMASRGLSLLEHQSRSVTTHALQTADLILTMTRSHRNAILDQMPEIQSKVKLVSGTSQDVSDPFGGPQSVYAACANQIDGFLDQWLQQLDDSLFPQWTL